MPVALLPKFLELPVDVSPDIAGFAFVMDLRERNFLSGYADAFESLRRDGRDFEVIFLEAEEEVLVRRYSQTRRHHPLSKGGSILAGIQAERNQLAPLREVADHRIDTSGYTVHELKKLISDLATESKQRIPTRIHVLSFGFKYGIPHDADLIVDVRFLANPYFVPELKERTGQDDAVREFVLDRDETREFLVRYFQLLDFLLPLYEREGKAYLTIAVGCTGGRHRSVAIAREVFAHIEAAGRWAHLTHRDIAKD